jgi:hypothetical protein
MFIVHEIDIGDPPFSSVVDLNKFEGKRNPRMHPYSFLGQIY